MVGQGILQASLLREIDIRLIDHNHGIYTFDQIEQLFPDVPILRMDTDTVSAVNSHEKILSRFQKEKIPVLIGTQMVAKGLNLPDVTLVGVLDADLSLYTGGYRAGETTFNMLTQVVGRAGRGASVQLEWQLLRLQPFRFAFLHEQQP